MGKLVCTNGHIKSQCAAMLNSITLFETALIMASCEDDKQTDKQEVKIIKEISKDVDKLKETLKKYAY